jgi:RNA polymerase sigma-70 factor (family 1)
LRTLARRVSSSRMPRSNALRLPQVAEPASTSSDSTLVTRIRAGDEAAFEQLFRRYYNPLCVFGTRYVRAPDLAEELVESVFARIWEQRLGWEVRGSLTAYLYAAVRHRALDHRRHEAIQGRMRERTPVPGMGQARHGPEQVCEANELEAAVRAAVERLPERCRLVFTLRWQHQLSYAEIAETLGIATKTVETQMNRALKALREQLRPYC